MLENANRSYIEDSSEAVVTWSDVNDDVGTSAYSVSTGSDVRLVLTSLTNILRALLLTLVTILGLAFNTFVFIAILPNRKLTFGVANIWYCHLAIVGTIWCTFLVPVSMAASYIGRWPFHRHIEEDDGLLCDAYGFVRVATGNVTVWTISILSWDKYQTIASPLRHSTTDQPRRVVVCLTAMWTLGIFVAALPLAAGVRSRYDYYSDMCDYPLFQKDSTSSLWYSILFVVSGFYLPLCVLVYCYCHIFRIARLHTKRIAVMAAMVHVITLSVGVPITSEQACQTSRQLTSRDRKASRTVCTFLGAFLLCYGPHSVTSLVEICTSTTSHPFPVAVSGLLLMTSPAVNAYVYGVRNRTLKESFGNCLRRQLVEYYSLRHPATLNDLVRAAAKSREISRRREYNEICHARWASVEKASPVKVSEGPELPDGTRNDDVRSTSENGVIFQQTVNGNPLLNEFALETIDVRE